MRWTKQLGFGMIVFFLISTGCVNSDLVKPPQEKTETTTQEEKEQVNVQQQSKSVFSHELVYLDAQEKKELSTLIKEPIIYKGSKHSKKVALTFDDGPDQDITKRILAILKKEQVPATFFVTGKMVKAYPEVLKEIYAQGHVIGNHTWSHPEMPKLSTQQIDQEINETNQVVEKVIGKQMQLMRPPYGATNQKVRDHLKKNGFFIINWSVDTNDWRGNSGPVIEQIVKAEMSNGGIVLQHNAGNKLEGTVDALPHMIKYLKEKNYQLVTVDQLLDISPYKETQPK